MCPLSVLVVADLVNRKEQVDEIAGRPELFVVGIGVGMGAEKLTSSLKEEGTLLVGEDPVAVDPFRRFGRGFNVVGVERPLERGDRVKVRENKRGGGRRHGYYRLEQLCGAEEVLEG